MSTSKCWRCGSENLALMRTLDKKYCACGTWMPWRLDAGQKPVGYGVDPEKVAACTGDVRAMYGLMYGGKDEH